MTDAVVAYQGWGSSAQAWGEGAWGTDEATGIPIATGAVGTVSLVTDQILAVTGEAGTGAVGTVAISAGCTVFPAGILATLSEGEVVIWIRIGTAQTPGWGVITDTQTPGWGDITTTQTPGWSEISTT